MTRVVLTLLALILSWTAWAVPRPKETSFGIPSNLGAGNRVYYNCESVENATRHVLSELGATEIRVKCTGGLDPVSRVHTDAFVRARFFVVEQGEFETVVFRDRTNCHLITEIFEGVRGSFILHNVQGVRRCWDASSPYHFSAEVLK